LVGGGFIYNIESRLALDPEDIDNNRRIEIQIVCKGELKPAGGLAMLLALLIVLCEMFDSFLLDFVASSFKNSL
jgi:hypothetical protein